MLRISGSAVRFVKYEGIFCAGSVRKVRFEDFKTQIFAGGSGSWVTYCTKKASQVCTAGRLVETAREDLSI